MSINREQYLKELVDKKDNGRVKIITGIKRCGKSFLLFELYKQYLLDCGVTENHIIEIKLDEIDYARYRNPFALNEYVKRSIEDTNRYYVFIDEIQMCSEIRNPYVDDPNEKISFVDTVLGLMKIKNADIYITGSNSRMLSKDVLTQFRDRGDEIHVMPLSFAEVASFYAERGNSESDAWRDYCVYGGMPYVLSLRKPEEKSRYLKDLFSETYLKDIVERNDIRNETEVLDVLMDFISSAIGSLTNPSKLANRFLSEKKIKISHSTIANYLELFEEAYIISSARKYDIKGADYFDTPLKYYFADIGLRNARLNFRQVEETHIMENIIYNDLIRRGYNVDVGVVPYSKTVVDDTGKAKKVRVQLEVDFVVNRGMQRYYIQSALHIEDEDKRIQETNSLSRINDSYKKIVVVKDDIIPWRDEKGILYVGIREFLLDDRSLEL